MRYERSCGAIVFTRAGGQLRYVLIQQLAGFYGFPKGHMEQGETERETALREVYEEVHLRPDLLDGFITRDEYPLPSKRNTRKQVTLFLGEYSDQDIIIQRSEVRSACLATYEEAMNLLRFPGSRRMLTEANDFLAGAAVSG